MTTTTPITVQPLYGNSGHALCEVILATDGGEPITCTRFADYLVNGSRFVCAAHRPGGTAR